MSTIEHPAVSTITVRFFAAARAAAGTGECVVPAPNLAELLVRLGAGNERLALVLKRSSFLVDGLACHDLDAALPSGAIVDVLPPFAGG